MFKIITKKRYEKLRERAAVADKLAAAQPPADLKVKKTEAGATADFRTARVSPEMAGDVVARVTGRDWAPEAGTGVPAPQRVWEELTRSDEAELALVPVDNPPMWPLAALVRQRLASGWADGAPFTPSVAAINWALTSIAADAGITPCDLLDTAWTTWKPYASSRPHASPADRTPVPGPETATAMAKALADRGEWPLAHRVAARIGDPELTACPTMIRRTLEAVIMDMKAEGRLTDTAIAMSAYLRRVAGDTVPVTALESGCIARGVILDYVEETETAHISYGEVVGADAEGTLRVVDVPWKTAAAH